MKHLKRMYVSLVTAAALSVGCIFTTAFAVDNTDANDNVPSTAVAVVRDMGNGTNLGNTMEACGSWINGSSPTSYETAWGQPVTTQAIIDGMKEAGYDSVRVPVAWSNMMSDDGKYTIDERYLDRVEEIVNYILNADMYVIVNDHWDGGWWGDFASKDETVANEAWKKYEAIWTQVGERFKDYSHKLIFESANEELGSSFKVSIYDRYQLITNINQKFVDIIRSQGGKNADRFLLIAGYDTNIDSTVSDRYVMPTDTIDNHLMISVHYYDPSPYTLVSDPNNSWGYYDSWGTDEDIEYMKNQLAKMKKFTKQGYGVIIGECGAISKRQDGTIKDGTYEWYENMLKICEQLNLCPMSWDCSTWYIRNQKKIVDTELARIFKENEYAPGNYSISGAVSVSDSDTGTDMTVTAVSADGQEFSSPAKSMGEYSITRLDAGTYTLKISGGKYAPREYSIEISDIDVSQDVTLNPYGDLNGDGKVTTADVGMANSHAKGVKPLEGYAFVCADVTGDDNTVTTADVGKINSHAKGVKALW